MKRAWIVIVVLVLAVVAFAARRYHLQAGPVVGREAPEIAGEDIDGRPMALSDFRGKVVVLDFWGDW
jgi:hypothetical protein